MVRANGNLPTRMASTILDVQGAQSVDHRGRGIGRYVTAHAGALLRADPDRFVAASYNPDLEPALGFEEWERQEKFIPLTELGTASVDTFHVMSPMEPGIPIGRLWPAAATRPGNRIVATVYDLIPAVFPAHYLGEARHRTIYSARLHLLRGADRLLAISSSTADDIMRILEVPSSRVDVIGAGVDDRYLPPDDRGRAAADAATALAGVAPGYIMYTGGAEWRKNMPQLVHAYARLPSTLREKHQLVIVCKLPAPFHRDLKRAISEAGVEGQVILTGFVPDDVLLRLYQGTELFVYPSLYEGSGLPVAEAQACGAVVIASDSSSLREFVAEEGRFDPKDIASIAGKMKQALTDDDLRGRLIAGAPPRVSWDDVAARTLDSYERLRPPSRSRRERQRMKLAFVSPLLPIPSGIADYSTRLIPHLAEHCDLDVFVDDQSYTEGLGDREFFQVSNLDFMEGLRGGYDVVLYSMGNSVFHVYTLRSLLRRPGVVLAHDVRFIWTYLMATRYGAIEGSFQDALTRMYGDDVPKTFRRQERLGNYEMTDSSILMLEEIVGSSELFLTTSEFAAQMARSHVAEEQASKVEAMPFAFSGRSVNREPAAPPVVASFGLVDPIKDPFLLVDACAIASRTVPGLQMVFVGAPGVGMEEAIGKRAQQQGIGGRVVVTGRVTEEEYDYWLSRTSVAVQLRKKTSGELSAALGDAISSGIPTVVTDIGAFAELPSAIAEKVAPGISPEELGALIAKLILDEDHAARLAVEGRTYADQNSNANVAKALIARLEKHCGVNTERRSKAREESNG